MESLIPISIQISTTALSESRVLNIDTNGFGNIIFKKKAFKLEYNL
jgi:hypothetical protein